jgi:hypothetical protein
LILHEHSQGKGRQDVGHDDSAGRLQKKAKNDRMPNLELQKELKGSALSLFEPVADLGYFLWNPNLALGYKNLGQIQSAEEIQRQTETHDAKPPVLVDLMSLPLPMNFVSMDPAGYLVKYPYKMPRVVPLHVAVQHRGVDLDTIDFLFHGSAMSWLAKRDNPIHEHLVGVVLPHSKKVVSVSKQREYTQDHTVAGFQFERLVTGKSFTDPHGFESVEHLHVMKVGNYTILFCAEVDAMMAEGNPVEVLTTHRDSWNEILSSISYIVCTVLNLRKGTTRSRT